MAFQTLKIFKVLRICRISNVNFRLSSTVTPVNKVFFDTSKNRDTIQPIQFRTEDNLVDLGDPDTFGTLSRKIFHKHTVDDEGDIKEEEFQSNKPLQSQKLTIKQYSDIMKQYIRHKRIKEAIDVLQNRMLKVDQVKPDNYIYNILIGACANVGYTKKAFKLFNDMKKRALKPTGDTYTCLFTACYNSPSHKDGLKRAEALRSLMVEKGIEPNLTNYNSMVKAFGKCGDLTTAFKIVDEMKAKKIKIRTHTYNHLLHACITDKERGLRYALLVWRSMLKNREKPSIYSFNLMLRCVKECNLGTKDDIKDLIDSLQTSYLPVSKETPALSDVTMAIASGTPNDKISLDYQKPWSTEEPMKHEENNRNYIDKSLAKTNDIQLLEIVNKPAIQIAERTVPNLLSKIPNMSGVLSLCEIKTAQEKFAVIGGQDDFLKEMAENKVKPDIKTFTQMLSVIDDNKQAELKLIETMKSENVKADIEFYNMLIRKRNLRADYAGAQEVLEYIQEENKLRKKNHPMKKKLILKPNIMTYGVLAMACKTKEDCIKYLNEMKEQQLKVNIEILGTLLRQGTAHCKFSYVNYVMKTVEEENLTPNVVFLKHLEDFVDKCNKLIDEHKSGEKDLSDAFLYSYESFMEFYKTWLADMKVEEVLKPVNHWAQFEQPHPETVQREPFKIVEPKKFYKRNRRFVKFVPRM